MSAASSDPKKRHVSLMEAPTTGASDGSEDLQDKKKRHDKQSNADESADEPFVVGEPSDDEDTDIVLPLDVIPELREACLEEVPAQEAATSGEPKVHGEQKHRPKSKEEVKRCCQQLQEVEHIGTSGKKITLIEGLEYCTELEVRFL